MAGRAEFHRAAAFFQYALRQAEPMCGIRKSLFVVTVLTVASAASAQDAAKPAEKVTYDDHVKPILRAKCFGCHNTDRKESDLDLTTFTSFNIGGASGEAFVPGSSSDSYLFSLITHESEPFMPPNSEKLPAPMIETIRTWIDGGALENKSSKARPKPKNQLAMAPSSSAERPAGPPPMPNVLSIEPIVVPKAATSVTAIASSPWAPLVAVAGQKQIVLYNSNTLEHIGILPFPEGIPSVLRFSRNGSLLLAGGGRGSYQGRVVVFDIKSGKRVIEVGDEVDTVLAADISSDHTQIALGGPQKAIRVYNTSDGSLAWETRKHTDWIYSIEFSPDGVLLATGDRNGGLHVWEAWTGREYLTLTGHKGSLNAVSWRGDSNVLASASEDRSIKLWEMEEGKQLKTWNAHGDGTIDIEFCRDGRIVSVGRDRVSKLWDQNAKQVRAFPPFSDLAVRVTYCDETNRLIAGDWAGSIQVWSAADGKTVGTLRQNPASLSTRIAQTQAAIQSVKQQKQSIAAEADKVRNSLVPVEVALKKAQQVQSSRKEAQTAANNALKEADSALKQLDTKIKRLEQRVDVLTTAIPKLKAAADKSQEASAANTAHAKLKGLAADLSALLTARVNDLATAQKSLADQRKMRPRLVADVTSATSKFKQMTASFTQSAKATAAKQEQVSAVRQNITSKEAEYEAAEAAIARKTDQLNELKHYLALRDEFAALKQTQTRLDAALDAEAEAREAFETSQAALDATREKLKHAESGRARANETIAASRNALKPLRTALAPELNAFNALRSAKTPLSEATSELAAAAATDKPDDTLVALNESLKLLDERTGGLLGSLQAQVQQKQSKIAKLKSQLAEAQKALKTHNQTIAASTSSVHGLAIQLTNLKTVFDQCVAETTEARAALQTASVAVAARQRKIRPAGVNQVSR